MVRRPFFHLRPKHWVFFTFVVSLLLLFYYFFRSQVSQDDNQNFEKGLDRRGFLSSFSEAKIKAQTDNLAILVYFHATWCPFSGKTIEDFFLDQIFFEFRSKFVLLQIELDTIEYLRLKQTYFVNGTDTILFLNPNGIELGRIYGSDLQSHGRELLSFFGQISRDGEFDPSVISSSDLLEALVAPVIDIDPQHRGLFISKMQSAVNIFKTKYPRVQVSQVEASLSLAKAEQNGTLANHFDYSESPQRDPRWMIRIAESQGLPPAKKEKILKKTSEDLSKLISMAETNNTESPHLKLYYELKALTLQSEAADQTDQLWEKYEDYVSREGQRRSHLVFLSHVWSWGKNYERSLDRYDELLRMFPNLMSLRVRKAKVLLLHGKNHEVIADLNQVIERTSGKYRLRAHFLLYEAYLATNQPEKAIRSLVDGKKYAETSYGKEATLFADFQKIVQVLLLNEASDKKH